MYYMLKENKKYTELGSEFYNKFNKKKKVNAYMKKLGYDVQKNVQASQFLKKYIYYTMRI